MAKGYVTSGRMRADIARDEAFSERKFAHTLFRLRCPNQARQHLRRALRAWANYRYFRERINV